MSKALKIVSIILMAIILVVSISTISMAFDATSIAASLSGTSTTAQGNITNI